MSSVHLHLLTTHLPIIGSILGAFVLGYGKWSRSNHTKIAAYFLFIISAIGTGIVYLTGEGAEEAVENLPGIAESIIEQHEDFAMYALVSLIVLGLWSIVALYLTVKKTGLVNMASTVALFISLIGFALVARTGYLGGQIRHSEISTNAVVHGPGGENDDDD